VERKRHPLLGLLAGLLLGLGLSLLLISHSIVFLGKFTPIVLIVVFLLLGLAAGLFGPVRRKA
jgi:uncharacterized membrane protein